MRALLFTWILSGGYCLLSTHPAAAADTASSKFIPTYTILYGNPKNARPAEETAKFDLLLSSFSKSYTKLWAANGRNSWQTLKALNPNMKILAYAMGPGEYNTANWGEIGEGWDWMKQHHGNESPDRWTARGIQFATYLQSRDYHNERLMDLGKPGWREYWIRNVYEDYWGGRKGIDLKGVDAIFSDNTSYGLPWAGHWYKEGEPEATDHPVDYYADGKYLQHKWQENVNRLLAEAVPFFREKGIAFTHNFESLGRHADWWQDLDSQPAPPFAAMDEGGFICPWGKAPARFFTWDWESRVRTLRNLKHVRALVNAHAVVPEGEGLAKMDVSDSTGMTGWDALWFSLTSFLLGYDDVARNAYMNFTVWSYSGYYWLDEFDPRYLHLGKALGEYRKTGALYLREFEDGFAVVNPGTTDAKDVPSPVAGVRVVNHANLRSVTGTQPVARFDLAAHRGVILLKPGRKIGNEDNPSR
jgi:hypothetical protein